MRRRDFSFLLLPQLQPDSGQISAFGRRWSVPHFKDWTVEQEDGREVLRLNVARPPGDTEVRRPAQHALLEEPPCRRFHLALDVRRDASRPNTAVVIIYAWQSPVRFNYIHLCQEAASQQPRHNGIFHVFDGERVRISPLAGPGTLTDGGWHLIDARWDGAKGRVECRVDGHSHPSLLAVDLSLTSGRLGLGSFFNTGSFRGFRLQSA